MNSEVVKCDSMDWEVMRSLDVISSKGAISLIWTSDIRGSDIKTVERDIWSLKESSEIEDGSVWLRVSVLSCSSYCLRGWRDCEDDIVDGKVERDECFPLVIGVDFEADIVGWSGKIILETAGVEWEWGTEEEEGEDGFTVEHKSELEDKEEETTVFIFKPELLLWDGSLHWEWADKISAEDDDLKSILTGEETNVDVVDVCDDGDDDGFTELFPLGIEDGEWATDVTNNDDAAEDKDWADAREVWEDCLAGIWVTDDG